MPHVTMLTPITEGQRVPATNVSMPSVSMATNSNQEVGMEREDGKCANYHIKLMQKLASEDINKFYHNETNWNSH